jgi:8-oxo-dGTP pyrophosphatase MutT (NUDIX family)
MDPKFFVAAKAFIENDGRILVLRESGKYLEGANRGSYDVPGGRARPGESLLECLEREVKEETGLDIEIGQPFHVAEWKPSTKNDSLHIIAVCFRCRSSQEEVILSGDHDGYAWIDPKDYENIGLIENLKPVFNSFLSISDRG